MVMGASQFFTTGLIQGRTIGARKAVPSKTARMVPLGDFHISVAASTVIWSRVAFRLSSPRS